MIIKEAIWFSSGDCIGIVATENDMGEINFYIGKGEGYDPEVDAQTIAYHGSKLNVDYLNQFLNRYIKKS